MNFGKAFSIVGLAALLLLGNPAQADHQKPTPGHGAHSPVGAWSLLITPDGDGPPAFQGVLAIHSDGTVTGSAQGDSLSNSYSTIGIGSWRRDGNNEFVFTLRFCWYLPEDGAPDGGNIVHNRFRLTPGGDSFEGEMQFEWLDVNDQVILTGTGTIQAVRIPAGP